jgi:hypothetical protein
MQAGRQAGPHCLYSTLLAATRAEQPARVLKWQLCEEALGEEAC